MEKVLGCSVDNLLGDIFLWYNSIHPDDKPLVDESIAKTEKGRGYAIEYRIKGKDGNWIWLFDRFISKYKKQNFELKTMLEELRTLRGLLPICSLCKKIHDDKGYWNQIESYIEAHSDVQFSHGMCPKCSDKMYGNEDWYIDMKKRE